MGQLAVVASEREVGAGAERAPILPFIVLPLKLMLARSLASRWEEGERTDCFSLQLRRCDCNAERQERYRVSSACAKARGKQISEVSRTEEDEWPSEVSVLVTL